jgi:hypothetical protein
LYPSSTWYKGFALKTLEGSLAINAITILVFWAYIFPNTGEDFYKSSLDEAFGVKDDTLTVIIQAYFWVRNIIVHNFPFIVSLTSAIMADVVFLETDWWINFDLAVVYVFTNYAITEYSGTDEVYYFNWGTKNSSIGSYSTIFESAVFGIIAFAIHFMMCLIT